MPDIIASFRTELEENGGSTVWTRIFPQPVTGYTVALQQYELQIDLNEYHYEYVTSLICDYFSAHVGIGDGIGGWVCKDAHEETGEEQNILYLDVVVHFNDMTEAVERGIEEKQLAIYSIHDDEVIYCNTQSHQS